MFYENTLVQLVRLETQGSMPTYAVRNIGRLEWFEFDTCTEFSIKEYLCLNHAPEGYYQVIGEDDGGIDEVRAVIYFRPKVPNEKKAIFKMMFPDAETKQAIKEWTEPKKIDMRFYNSTAKSGEIPIVNYAPVEAMKGEDTEGCSTQITTE